MGQYYNVWHIASEWVYLVAKRLPEEKAHHLADTLQELSYLGIVPGVFYLAVPVGSDGAWFEAMKHNPTDMPLTDYSRWYSRYGKRVQQRVRKMRGK